MEIHADNIIPQILETLFSASQNLWFHVFLGFKLRFGVFYDFAGESLHLVGRDSSHELRPPLDTPKNKQEEGLGALPGIQKSNFLGFSMFILFLFFK